MLAAGSNARQVMLPATPGLPSPTVRWRIVDHDPSAPISALPAWASPVCVRAMTRSAASST